MDAQAAMASYFVAFMLTWHAVDLARKRGRGYTSTLVIVRGMRPRHLATGTGVLLATAMTCAALVAAFPALEWGWWAALGGKGSIVFAQSDAAASPAATPLLAALPFIVPALLALVIPSLARLEERQFRRGLQRRPLHVQLRVQLIFGLLHLAMGIPIAAGLALAVTGTLYLTIYRRTLSRTGSQGLAVLEATRVHAAANFVVVLLVAIALAL